MINYQDTFRLYDYFSYIFFYGFKNRYSYDYIQDRLSSSYIVKDLEDKGNSDFLFNSSLSESIKSIYQLNDIDIDSIVETNTISLWVSEAYLRLFFKYHKSFGYLFVYLPIERMLSLFDLYHELDWTRLFEVYEEEIKQSSLLKKILEKKSLSLHKLSELTGISKSTLVSYLKDSRFKEAKFEYVYKIASVCSLDINIFANNVNNYIDAQVSKESINKELFNTLALFVLHYQSQEIASRNYQYNKEKDLYISGDKTLKVLITSISTHYLKTERLNEEAKKMLDRYSHTLSKEERQNQIVVLYELNQNSVSLDVYKSWLDYGFEKIYIYNPINLLCIKTDSKKSYLNQDTLEKIKARILSNN